MRSADCGVRNIGGRRLRRLRRLEHAPFVVIEQGLDGLIELLARENHELLVERVGGELFEVNHADLKKHGGLGVVVAAASLQALSSDPIEVFELHCQSRLSSVGFGAGVAVFFLAFARLRWSR